KYLYHLNSITRILDEINPGKYEAGPDDYYGLLKWGILKKKGRKLVPTDIDDVFEATNNFEKEKSQIYSAKTWISDIIYDSNSLPIQKFAKILKISLVDAEDLVYELVAEGIDGVLEEGVFKFNDKPYKVVSKLEELIDKILPSLFFRFFFSFFVSNNSIILIIVNINKKCKKICSY
ncbi:unnamed protein product, partial [marine sediment metagenome]